MKRFIALILVAITVLSLAISALAVEKMSIGTVGPEISTDVFYTNKMNGKIFYGGVNMTVSDKSMFDTSISDVSISKNLSTMTLSYTFDEYTFSIPIIPLPAQNNNEDKDHYVFSTLGFENNSFRVINISLALSANKKDLIPANYDLIDKKVLTIIIEGISTNDVYYWQGEIIDKLGGAKSNISEEFTNMSNSVLENSKTLLSEDKLRISANESYYFNNISTTLTLTEDEFDRLSSERLEEQASTASTINEDTNPLYEYFGVPDSALMSATEAWTQGVIIAGQRNYYAYSAQKFGDPNIYTIIMVLYFYDTGNPMGLDYQNSVYKANRELQIEVKANEEIIYYVSEDVFELTGNINSVHLYPTITLKKRGTNPSHVVVAREFGGQGRKGVARATKILNLFVGVVDDYLTNGAISRTIDILDIIAIGTENYSFGSTRKLYPETAERQEQDYGVSLGSMRMEMDGYIVAPGDYFRCYCEFAANTSAVATNTTWSLSMQLDY